MSNKRRSDRSKSRHEEGISSLGHQQVLPLAPVRQKGPLTPKTKNQAEYISSIRHNRITFGIGPAGVGKTYVAARVAAEQILDRTIERIVLTRPAVEVGQSIGYLPGELEEKMAPYMASYGRGFSDGLGQGHFEYLLRQNRIEIVPLNFMQGRSFDEPTLVLFDEAENATPAEMKMFLTRIGEGARMVIDGDPTQKMIKGQSGLIDGMKRLRYLKQVGVVEFTREDIVRDGLIRAILDAYDDQDNEGEQGELPLFITKGSH